MPKSDTWFKSGESGNPKGRPNGKKSFTWLIKRELKKTTAVEDAQIIIDPNNEGEVTEQTKFYELTKKEKMIFMAVQAATNESVDPATRLRYLQFLVEKIDGKEVQPVDLTTKGKKINNTPTLNIQFEPRNEE